MPCTFCDAPLPTGARYCPQCGTAVWPTEAAGNAAPDATYGDPGPLHGKPDPVYGAYDEPGGEVRPPVSTSTTAIVSLACGIAAWTLLPIVGAIFAVITGHQARREIERSGGTLEGEGLATVGLILGYLQLIPLMIGTLMLLIALLLGLGVATFHLGAL